MNFQTNNLYLISAANDVNFTLTCKGELFLSDAFFENPELGEGLREPGIQSLADVEKQECVGTDGLLECSCAHCHCGKAAVHQRLSEQVAGASTF